jgi:hypothetical protein
MCARGAATAARLAPTQASAIAVVRLKWIELAAIDYLWSRGGRFSDSAARVATAAIHTAASLLTVLAVGSALLAAHRAHCKAWHDVLRDVARERKLPRSRGTASRDDLIGQQ